VSRFAAVTLAQKSGPKKPLASLAVLYQTAAVELAAFEVHVHQFEHRRRDVEQVDVGDADVGVVDEQRGVVEAVHAVAWSEAEHLVAALESGFEVVAVVRDDDEVRGDVVVVAAEGLLFGDDAVGDRLAVRAFEGFEFGLEFVADGFVVVLGTEPRGSRSSRLM